LMSGAMSGVFPPLTTHALVGEAKMEIAVYDNLEELEGIYREWNDLRERHNMVTPTTEPRRFHVVAKARAQGGRPYVALFRDDRGPRALLIGQMSHRCVTYKAAYLRLKGPRMRCLDIVYDGLLADDDETVRNHLLAHLESLFETNAVQHISINHLRVGSSLHRALRKTFARRAIEVQTDAHWRFLLAGESYEKVLRRFSSKHRYNIRRTDRRLVEHFLGNVRLVKCNKPTEITAYLDRVNEVSRRTYQFALGAAVVRDALWEALSRVEAESGHLRGYILECGGQPIAYEHGELYGKTFFLEARGYVPEYASLESGNVLFLRMIEDLCSLGVEQIDYGFGDGEYKRIYGSENWLEATIHLYGRGISPMVGRLLASCSRSVSEVARRTATLGPVKKVKKWWRGRLSRSAGGTQTANRASTE
jgi:CelD/BcsL family acetyltransferase involved in cellulose biosynthesis